MNRLVKFWKKGIDWFIKELIISYYVYFTFIVSECIFLWCGYQFELALPFTILLLATVLNIIISALVKGNWEGLKVELIASISYVLIFCVLFIGGCIIDTSLTIKFIGIPLIITFIELHLDRPVIILKKGKNGPYILSALSKFYDNKFLYVFSRIIIIGCPYVVFLKAIAIIPTFPIVAKVLIATLYLLLIPFISIFEDFTLAGNIFEMAYDITYHKSRES